MDSAIYVSLGYAGMDMEKTKQFAAGWATRNIKG